MGLVLALILMVGVAFANKTSVKVTVPENIAKGKDVTVVIQVSHKGNSKMHHTNWVTLSVNGKEVKKWEYSSHNLPPNEEFTLEYTLTPTDNIEITAQGNCNLHGSAGPDTKSVKVE